MLKGERIHQGDLSKRVRFTTTLRDAATGKTMKAHFISYGDYSGYGNYDNIWAGMSIGDLYYEGNKAAPLCTITTSFMCCENI